MIPLYVYPMTAGDLKSRFGTTIKSKRSELGISQEELADRAGLHRTYISDVERGVRNLSLESIGKLAAALEISVARLFHRAISGDHPEQPVEILLVEDEPADVELTLRAFRQARFTNPVHVVGDGQAALDFIFASGPYAYRRRETQPGVLLLDLRLPKLGGLEVLRRIRADKRTKKLPVIILTASGQQDPRAECERLGVDNYLVKPVAFKKNFSEIATLMKFKWALVNPE